MTAYAYYNEIDPYAAQWLRNLIAAGHIAPGEVDERSITDVRADDLRGFVQCHFFAGIGGWDYALRLAGWPAERPIWTGSCPCQPFSVAGKGAGTSDERHLWPHWFRLIRECRPGVVFGEQVEAAIGHGWLDAVQTDLEGEGYAVGAVGLPAASVGAPHIRQRLWFVADSRKAGQRLERRSGLQHGERAAQRNNTYGCGAAGGMGDSSGEIFPQRIGNGRVQRETLESSTRQATVGTSDLGWLENAECATGARLGQHSGAGLREQEATGSCGSSGTGSWWGDSEWIYCTDEKYRPTKPGIFPLADGVAGRVGRLRAYGNAIVPQVAAQVIAAYMECRP